MIGTILSNYWARLLAFASSPFTFIVYVRKLPVLDEEESVEFLS
jgi:hypothetical protein